MLRDGKENSCERNPGGVSFAFNHRYFELIKFRKSCSSVSKNFFDTLLAAGFSGSQQRWSIKGELPPSPQPTTSPPLAELAVDHVCSRAAQSRWGSFSVHFSVFSPPTVIHW